MTVQAPRYAEDYKPGETFDLGAYEDQRLLLAASRSSRRGTTRTLAVERDAAVDAWFESRAGRLGAVASPWYERIRRCGDDVRELLHDGHPNAFTAHVNVGCTNAPGDRKEHA